MGDLKAHVFVGVFSVAVSFMWLWAWMHRYFKARLSSASSPCVQSTYKFKSSLTFVCHDVASLDKRCWRSFPIAFAVAFILLMIGLFGKFNII
jgi:hypothetical protein